MAEEEEIEKPEPKSKKEAEAIKKLNFVEDAKLTAERLEKANEELKRLLPQLEELRAREILGGRSDAGKSEEIKVEETPQEYLKKVLANKL